MGATNDIKDKMNEQQVGSEEYQGLNLAERQGYTDYVEYEPEEIDI